MAKGSVKRRDVFFVDTDTKKIIKQLEDAGKSTHKALERAIVRSLPLIESEFKAFIKEHHHTGETESALMSSNDANMEWGKGAKKKWVASTKKGVKGFSGGQTKVISEDEVLFVEYGFKAEGNPSGLPSLFLDIGVWENGSPKQVPTFFIYYSIERNLSRIHAIQKEELMKIVRGLD